MKDYPRFILRGAATSAAVELSALIYFLGPFAVAIFYHPVSLVYMILPGATVGLALWAIGKETLIPLTPGNRFSIGTAVVAVLATAGALYTLSSDELAQESAIAVFLRVPIFAASVGGLAGLACPSTREYVNRESELPYRERARQYEADEREAKLARERLLSKRILNSAGRSGL